MGTPTVDDIMRAVGARHARDEVFTGQPVLRALVLALATVLVGREDDAGMEHQVAVVLSAVLPRGARPAPRLHALAEEMARRMFSPEVPGPSLVSFLEAEDVERFRITADLDGILLQLRGFIHTKE